MRCAPAILALLLAAGSAWAGVEVMGVESATGGIWRPGRFSVARVRVRATPGRHEIRGRLEPGKVVVVTLEVAGGEEIVLLPLLPERDSDTVEIEAGAGYESHPLVLRKHDEQRAVVGVIEGLVDRPDIAWHEVPLPADGGPAALRDVCDLVLDASRLAATDLWILLRRRQGGPLTTGPVVSGVLADRFATATVPPSDVGNLLPVLATAMFLLFSSIHLPRRLGWTPVATVGVAATMCVVLLVAWWGVSVSTPRVTCRGLSLVRADGGRSDLLVFAARGRETVSPRFSDGPDLLVRPLPDQTGRIGPYTLHPGAGLDGVALGPGRLGFVRVDRGWPRHAGALGEVSTRAVEDAFWADEQGGGWYGDAWPVGPKAPPEPNEPMASILDRFREPDGTRPLTLRGRLLQKIARPGLTPGPYGFLLEPPRLDAQTLGVERAEIVEAILVP